MKSDRREGAGGQSQLDWAYPAGELNIKTIDFSITHLFKFDTTYTRWIIHLFMTGRKMQKAQKIDN